MSALPGPEVPDGGIGVDESLLRGFGFRCLPECGLCCYTTPSVPPTDRPRLIQLRPELRLEELADGEGRIPQQGPGGACALLEGTRCSGHAGRPFPCRLFPIHAHVGRRVQLSVVLSCPGISWTAFDGEDPPTQRSPPAGLEDELGAFRQRWQDPTVRRAAARIDHWHRRAISRASRRPGWSEVEDWREELRRSLAEPVVPRSDPFELPEEADGLDRLPIYHEAGRGLVALARSGAMVELLRLRPKGGIAERLGRFPSPSRIPPIDPGGRRLLRGYLRYLVDRDAYVDAVLNDWIADDDGEPVLSRARDDLAQVAGWVALRGELRARSAGRPEATLSAREIAEGIRATDADLLDRPVLGAAL